MSKIAVIYKSRYGSSKRYAQWIAQALKADLLERRSVKASQLKDYDIVIYGGGLYAGGLLGSRLVSKHPCKLLIVFTVGLADPSATDYSQIMARAFPNPAIQPAKTFHFRGGIDYKKLAFHHAVMMKMVKKEVEKKGTENLGQEEKALLDTYGKQVDFCDSKTIEPLLAYVRYLASLDS